MINESSVNLVMKSQSPSFAQLTDPVPLKNVKSEKALPPLKKVPLLLTQEEKPVFNKEAVSPFSIGGKNQSQNKSWFVLRQKGPTYS